MNIMAVRDERNGLGRRLICWPRCRARGLGSFHIGSLAIGVISSSIRWGRAAGCMGISFPASSATGRWCIRPARQIVPAGTSIVFQVHYNPNGKAHQSTSRLRLWFADEPPEEAVDMHAASTVVFRIPPGAPNHEVTAVHRFQRDGLLLGFSLTCIIGKSFRYVAEYPDGRKETLLHVPDFDFNWQHKYELAKPRWLPRGACCVRLALSITVRVTRIIRTQNGQFISACNPRRKCLLATLR